MIKLAWDEAMEHTTMIHELMKTKKVNITSVEVTRMDGSTVRVVYYPKPDRFMARRYRADGRLGASKQFNGDKEGLMDSFHYMLSAKFREA